MIDFLVQLIVWLNAAADALGRIVLAPIGVMPGWLSATIVSAVTGVLLLAVFKFTSNQRAIKKARDDINANLLALKLFKESTSVALQAQGRILFGALRLFVLAIVPMIVMAVPVTLLLGQLSLWYQFRPLEVGEEAVVTLKLGGTGTTLPAVRLEATPAAEVLIGPVRVPSKREVCWKIRARENGLHRLVFGVGETTIDKELAVSRGLLRVSKLRPGWDWSDILMNPQEAPFPPTSEVHSIDIDYPGRDSWTSGTDVWVFYWFGVSMVAAFVFRRALNVNI